MLASSYCRTASSKIRPAFSVDRAKKIPAFSLLEILIAITIMAMMLGFSLPGLFRGLNNDLRKTLREISAYTENLRFLSIIDNKPYKLVFDFDKNRIYVEGKIDGKWQELNEKFNAIELEKGFELGFFRNKQQLTDVTKSSVYIFPFGYIEPFEISLTSANESLIFKIYSALGSAKIEENTNLFLK